MADKKNKEEERVQRILPLLPYPNAPQEEFFAVNGKNYIIKRGTPVMVPVFLAEVIDNAMKAEYSAYEYANSVALREPTNQ